jgi:hypothetical protein
MPASGCAGERPLPLLLPPASHAPALLLQRLSGITRSLPCPSHCCCCTLQPPLPMTSLAMDCMLPCASRALLTR